MSNPTLYVLLALCQEPSHAYDIKALVANGSLGALILADGTL
jgi:DNA-binding PadR family transcriptional regulator